METAIFIVLFLAFDVLLFWLSAKPERMSWTRDPSDPVIRRLVMRGAAWVFFAFIVFSLLAITISRIVD